VFALLLLVVLAAHSLTRPPPPPRPIDCGSLKQTKGEWGSSSEPLPGSPLGFRREQGRAAQRVNQQTGGRDSDRSRAGGCVRVPAGSWVRVEHGPVGGGVAWASHRCGRPGAKGYVPTAAHVSAPKGPLHRIARLTNIRAARPCLVGPPVTSHWAGYHAAGSRSDHVRPP
jgi:hypothetical protein